MAFEHAFTLSSHRFHHVGAWLRGTLLMGAIGLGGAPRTASACDVPLDEPYFLQTVAPPGGVFVIHLEAPTAEISDEAHLLDEGGTQHPLVVIDRVGISLTIHAPEVPDTRFTVVGLSLPGLSDSDGSGHLRTEGVLSDPLPAPPTIGSVTIGAEEVQRTDAVIIPGPPDPYQCAGPKPLVADRSFVVQVIVKLNSIVLEGHDVLILDGWLTEPDAALDITAAPVLPGVALHRGNNSILLNDETPMIGVRVPLESGQRGDLHLRLREPMIGQHSEIVTITVERTPDEDIGVGCASSTIPREHPLTAIVVLLAALSRCRRRQ